MAKTLEQPKSAIEISTAGLTKAQAKRLAKKLRELFALNIPGFRTESQIVLSVKQKPSPPDKRARR